MDIKIALTIDVLLLISSQWCILQVSPRSIFNPSLWWVALHAYSVTFRLVTLNLGVQSISALGVRSDTEFVNAAIASDISLISVVAATIFFAQRSLRERATNHPNSVPVQLNPHLGQIISILCLTIGTYALLVVAGAGSAVRVRGIDINAINIGSLEQSSYPYMISGFAVQGVLIQLAMRGFNRWRIALLVLLLVPTSLYLARTFFVLVTVMAFLIYQTQRNKTKLTAKWALGTLLLGLVWFVYKPIEGAINEGLGAEQAIANARDYFSGSLGETPSIDSQFFDMQATFMGAADETGRRFYGATVLPLMYLPIPRFIWPDKPRVNEYAWELTSSLRPIAVVGMVPLLSGEAYLNFGWIGCAVIPFIYILGIQTFYVRTKTYGIISPARFMYVVFLVSMLQVYRDGISALILYPFTWYLPLAAWAIISWLLGPHWLYGRHFNRDLGADAASNRVS
jgi:hypothetical protein